MPDIWRAMAVSSPKCRNVEESYIRQGPHLYEEEYQLYIQNMLDGGGLIVPIIKSQSTASVLWLQTHRQTPWLVMTLLCSKCRPKTYPGYCLHLWNTPLQPIIILSNATTYETNLTSSDFTVQLEMVAGENYIDVGNILGKFWVSLWQEWFTPRNLELSAWRRSIFMSTSVDLDTGEVSTSDTSQADSSI